jgi:hypothetical protein
MESRIISTFSIHYLIGQMISEWLYQKKEIWKKEGNNCLKLLIKYYERGKRKDFHQKIQKMFRYFDTVFM